MKTNVFKNFFTWIKDGMKRNTSLKIISLVLAIFLWAYILYSGSTVYTSYFEKLPVTIVYEGSVPERNGLMLKMLDTNLTVDVTVQGPRSKLITKTKTDVKVALNLDSVVSAGTYTLPVSTNIAGDNLSITAVSPATFTIEFSNKGEKTLPVTLTEGTLPENYRITSTEIFPKEITVSGPAEDIAKITDAVVALPVLPGKDSFSDTFPIQLLSGKNKADRSYMTLSSDTANVSIQIAYARELPLEVKLTNPSGKAGELFDLSVTPPSVTVFGTEEKLKNKTSVLLGDLDTSSVSKETEREIALPFEDGISYSAETVKVKLTPHNGLTTKKITFSSFRTVNVPSGMTAAVNQKSLTASFLVSSADAKLLTSSSVQCVVNLGAQNADGTYAVYFTGPAETAFNVLGAYSVEVTLK